MPKASHLTWEEAASPGLLNRTAYRQLVSRNGARMKLGDVILIWGARGGLSSYATQMALASGASPICIVSSPDKAEICHKMGTTLVIDRSNETGEGLLGSGRTRALRTRANGSASAPRSAS